MKEPQERSSFRDLMRVRTVDGEIASGLPRALRIATAYAWRLLVIAAAVGVIVWLVIQLKLLVIPLMVAILLTALIWPAFAWMLRKRVPRVLAVTISLIGTLAIVTGLMWLVVWQISQDWPSVRDRTQSAITQFQDFLITGPLHLTEKQIGDAIATGWTFLQQQADSLFSGALAIGTTVGHLATGLLLTIFILICLLADGGSIWRWVVKLFPKTAREAIDGAGRTGWTTVKNYTRTQLIVATIDAIGIGLVAFFLGVPLAVPVAVLVFLGAFVPIVGAVLTGAVAVFLALVYNGPIIAIWMLVGVLGVQQLEGHILQPLLMGSAVKVHPLAVVLVVAGGTMVGGIPGALFAVPLAAFVNAVAISLSTGAWRTGTVVERDDMIWRTEPRKRRRT